MLITLRNVWRTFSPLHILLTGFIFLTLVGALLLTLPFASQTFSRQSFVDALFTATSAVSTTGLVVVSTGSYYSLFGQIVIMVLCQIGGLGYMTLIVFIMHLFGQKLSFRSGNLMEEALAVPSRSEMRTFVRRVVLFTALFEGAGTLALTLHWLREFPLPMALYQAVFHSVSAFCTAGFALFDNGFVAYQNNWYFNIVINIVSYAGAVGFLVLNEAYLVVRRSRRGRHYRLSSHSRLALIVLGLMSLLGTAVVYWSEGVYSSQGWLQASFQAITAASTTGFNTVDIGQMSDTSQSVLSVLMFIGSPSGGTGGGIKSTTFGVIMLLLWALLRNHSYVNFSGRRLSTQTLIKSVGIGITAVIWLLLVTICLTATEEKSFLSLLFEATSALGTVGLSTGLTSQLSVFGKLLLTATMFIGRVGPLTVALSLFGVQTERKVYRYPQEEIFVG